MKLIVFVGSLAPHLVVSEKFLQFGDETSAPQGFSIAMVAARQIWQFDSGRDVLMMAPIYVQYELLGSDVSLMFCCKE